MITDTRKIFYPAASDQNHGVLLEVMPDTWDI
jgi:hypothetical protein